VFSVDDPLYQVTPLPQPFLLIVVQVARHIAQSMLLVVLPEAEERATAVVVGVLAVAVAFVFFEMADVLGYLIRPLERTLPMLHVICPLTVVKSAVRPLKTA